MTWSLMNMWIPNSKYTNLVCRVWSAYGLVTSILDIWISDKLSIRVLESVE